LIFNQRIPRMLNTPNKEHTIKSNSRIPDSCFEGSALTVSVLFVSCPVVFVPESEHIELST